MVAKRWTSLFAVLVTMAVTSAVIDVDSGVVPGAAADASTPRGTIAVVAPHPFRCDPIAARGCLYPFPNDHFTVRDRSTATGRRIALARASMPTNVDGVAVDPTE